MILASPPSFGIRKGHLVTAEQVHRLREERLAQEVTMLRKSKMKLELQNRALVTEVETSHPHVTIPFWATLFKSISLIFWTVPAAFFGFFSATTLGRFLRTSPSISRDSLGKGAPPEEDLSPFMTESQAWSNLRAPRNRWLRVGAILTLVSTGLAWHPATEPLTPLWRAGLAATLTFLLFLSTEPKPLPAVPGSPELIRWKQLLDAADKNHQGLSEEARRTIADGIKPVLIANVFRAEFIDQQGAMENLHILYQNVFILAERTLGTLDARLRTIESQLNHPLLTAAQRKAFSEERLKLGLSVYEFRVLFNYSAHYLLALDAISPIINLGSYRWVQPKWIWRHLGNYANWVLGYPMTIARNKAKLSALLPVLENLGNLYMKNIYEPGENVTGQVEKRLNNTLTKTPKTFIGPMGYIFSRRMNTRAGTLLVNISTLIMTTYAIYLTTRTLHSFVGSGVVPKLFFLWYSWAATGPGLSFMMHHFPGIAGRNDMAYRESLVRAKLAAINDRLGEAANHQDFNFADIGKNAYLHQMLRAPFEDPHSLDLIYILGSGQNAEDLRSMVERLNKHYGLRLPIVIDTDRDINDKPNAITAAHGVRSQWPALQNQEIYPHLNLRGKTMKDARIVVLTASGEGQGYDPSIALPFNLDGKPTEVANGITTGMLSIIEAIYRAKAFKNQDASCFGVMPTDSVYIAPRDPDPQDDQRLSAAQKPVMVYCLTSLGSAAHARTNKAGVVILKSDLKLVRGDQIELNGNATSDGHNIVDLLPSFPEDVERNNLVTVAQGANRMNSRVRQWRMYTGRAWIVSKDLAAYGKVLDYYEELHNRSHVLPPQVGPQIRAAVMKPLINMCIDGIDIPFKQTLEEYRGTLESKIRKLYRQMAEGKKLAWNSPEASPFRAALEDALIRLRDFFDYYVGIEDDFPHLAGFASYTPRAHDSFFAFMSTQEMRSDAQPALERILDSDDSLSVERERQTAPAAPLRRRTWLTAIVAFIASVTLLSIPSDKALVPTTPNKLAPLPITQAAPSFPRAGQPRLMRIKDIKRTLAGIISLSPQNQLVITTNVSLWPSRWAKAHPRALYKPGNTILTLRGTSEQAATRVLDTLRQNPRGQKFLAWPVKEAWQIPNHLPTLTKAISRFNISLGNSPSTGIVFIPIANQRKMAFFSTLTLKAITAAATSGMGFLTPLSSAIFLPLFGGLLRRQKGRDAGNYSDIFPSPINAGRGDEAPAIQKSAFKALFSRNALWKWALAVAVIFAAFFVMDPQIQQILHHGLGESAWRSMDGALTYSGTATQAAHDLIAQFQSSPEGAKYLAENPDWWQISTNSAELAKTIQAYSQAHGALTGTQIVPIFWETKKQVLLNGGQSLQHLLLGWTTILLPALGLALVWARHLTQRKNIVPEVVSTPLPVIVLDVSNVLVKTRPMRILQALNRHSHLSWRDKFPVILRVLKNNWELPLVRQFEAGALTPEEFFIAMKKDLRLDDLTQKEFFELWVSHFDFNAPGMIDLATVQSLKKAGHKLYALSNIDPIRHAYLLSETSPLAPLLNELNGFFASYTLHRTKPDQTLYREVAKTLGVAEENILFVDDSGTNIRGAEAVGWMTIQFRNLRNSLVQLRAKGIALPEISPIIPNRLPNRDLHSAA